MSDVCELAGHVTQLAPPRLNDLFRFGGPKALGEGLSSGQWVYI